MRQVRCKIDNRKVLFRLLEHLFRASPKGARGGKQNGRIVEFESSDRILTVRQYIIIRAIIYFLLFFLNSLTRTRIPTLSQLSLSFSCHHHSDGGGHPNRNCNAQSPSFFRATSAFAHCSLVFLNCLMFQRAAGSGAKYAGLGRLKLVSLARQRGLDYKGIAKDAQALVRLGLSRATPRIP